MRILLPVLACALTGCAASATPQNDARDEAKLAAALAGLTPQKPVSCIDNYGSASIKAYGATILYEVGRGLVYRTETGGGCEKVGRGDVLVTRSISGRLCSGDIAQTYDSTSRFLTGSCSLGAFTPYRKVAQ
ncbi:MAG: hypothetical protein P0Y59_13595 [Candidatus Sphingomonas phytovorans]|nr:hypothetical protein [Sphingomonas sp.]WEJ97992.1 MAG: hypothetical protein P0Y59_13595 [Sphingomonas sp.]